MLELFPVDTSDFESIIKGRYIYVDKTKYIHNLVTKFSNVFLCRPRRFGKSLLIDTMDKLFSGRKELFSNLWIGSSDYSFDEFPVIRLDFSVFPNNDEGKFTSTIIKQLQNIAYKFGIQLSDNGLQFTLSDLIEQLNLKFNKKIVILIDEYDAPLIEPGTDYELINRLKNILHNFYKVIKALGNQIRFVFVTGITQIVRTAIGQSNSNLKDISISEEFSSICGFTIAEMDLYFSKYYKKLLKNLIKSNQMTPDADINDFRKTMLNWFDGYNFNLNPNNKINVVNPVSINNFFSENILTSYWVQTGPPRYLSEQIKKNPTSFFKALSIGQASKSCLFFKRQDLTTLDLHDPAPLPLLFQTGYLTLNKMSYEFNNELTYALKFPNIEVTYAWQSALYQGLFTAKFMKNSKNTRTNFIKSILLNNESDFESIISNAISSLAFNEEPSNEEEYQRVLHILFVGWDLEVFSHIPSPYGISDLEIALDEDTHAVIELKYLKPETGITPEKRAKDVENTARRALRQIVKKAYGHRGGRPAKTLIRIGLVVHECDKVRAMFSMDGSIPEKPRRPRRPKAAKTPPNT
ncbi:MAG: AAA family ATPase [Holosporales bacterium]|jgi:hypothetical protein|nr:AAA family ATPase [Holosporales bacterium]